MPGRRSRDKSTKTTILAGASFPRPLFGNKQVSEIAGRNDWRLPRSVSILMPLPAMQRSSGELSESLQDIAVELCTTLTERRDPATSKIMRAIGFFELQVRILAPDSAQLQRRARTIAIIKFLEAIEKKAAPSRVDFVHYLQLPDYRHLVDLLFAAGGWRGIRSLPSTESFDQELAKLQQQCRGTASMVSLAYRFRKVNSDSTLVAGKNMAVAVASELYRSQRGFSTRTLENRLAQAGDFAILQYLLVEHFPQLRPPQAAKNDFIVKLLNQSKRTSMQTFFAGYQEVWSALHRQFAAPKVFLPNLPKPPALLLRPLSEREKKHIRDHYKAKGAELRL